MRRVESHYGPGAPEPWEESWQAKDAERAHLDVVAERPSLNSSIYRPFVDKLVSQYKNATVLEAGSGLGQWVYYLAHKPVQKIVGLDFAAATQERVGATRTLGPYVESGVVELVVGDIREIPISDESFDLVFSFGVIEHVSDSDSQRAVTEFARVLRPGGQVFLTTPNLYCMHTITRPFLRLLGKWTVGFERSIAPRKLRSYVIGANLSVEESGVLPSGLLFGGALTTRLPVLRSLSLIIERQSRTAGFLSYVVGRK
ncbi:MAG: class I SAM-dependent methyltransferase [Rhodanobacter sp.]|nr:MAG: class I SAM-dependent methyltransferase [Rhodanobacter sp.]